MHACNFNLGPDTHFANTKFCSSTKYHLTFMAVSDPARANLHSLKSILIEGASVQKHIQSPFKHGLFRSDPSRALRSTRGSYRMRAPKKISPHWSLTTVALRHHSPAHSTERKREQNRQCAYSSGKVARVKRGGLLPAWFC